MYDVVEEDEKVEVCVITCSDIGDRVIKVHVFGPNDEKIPPGAAIASKLLYYMYVQCTCTSTCMCVQGTRIFSDQLCTIHTYLLSIQYMYLAGAAFTRASYAVMAGHCNY